ncbi:mitochondrial outer membrane protein porin 1-like [Triticum dicoccoides]|uniref:mitochondrial outer membrane protein porin 1-like n=1 Tax=Triticum dicoccoides TaxID=85692 RepID=UPI001890986B|nr:mitochondrial outer membrane protein porin 1-like [Triticum dicoccoides]
MADPVDAPSKPTPVDVPSKPAPVDVPSKPAPVDAPSKAAQVDGPSMAAQCGAPPKAATGPGLYSEIGKKARDLLCKDFTTDQKLTLTTYAANGTAITATSTTTKEAVLGEIQTQFKYNNVKIDVKANSDSQVLITTTSETRYIPGLKRIVTVPLTNHTPAKAELQYFHDYAGISVGFGLHSKPLINVSALVGNKAFALGADVAYDSATGDFTKYNFGASFTNDDLYAAVMLNNKGDSLSASYYQMVSNSQAAAGGEVSHSLSSHETTTTLGFQYSLDPLTTTKVRYDNHGMVRALIQHELRPKSLLTISSEFDTKAIEKSSKIGLSLLLKP